MPCRRDGRDPPQSPQVAAPHTPRSWPHFCGRQQKPVRVWRQMHSACPRAGHARRGELVYVHCKAGRGRSTTLVLCYLVKEFGMTPAAALEMVRAKRHQVRLAPVRRCPGNILNGLAGNR